MTRNFYVETMVKFLMVFGILLSTGNLFAQYCTSNLYSIGCSSGDYLGLVQFNTINNNTGTNCPTGGYADFTTISTIVSKNQTYPITVGAAGGFSQGFGVWIDYNQNGSFNDPGEFVYASPTYAAAPTTFTGSVTIPATAFSGPTRMRVRAVYFSTVNAGESCTNFTFGETEDYTIIILGSGLNDAGVTSIDSPSNFCAGLHNVKATVQNFGINAITGITVNWSINGSAQTPVNYSGTLDTIGGAGVNKVQVNLGNFNFLANQTYNLKVWTSNPNNAQDTTNLNDTASITIGAALFGTFTIGGAGANYATLAAAANDLNLKGICGPVIFNVNPGTYTGRLVLDEVPGTSATNTITFNGNGAILNYNASVSNDRAAILLNGTDYVRINGFVINVSAGTYGFGIHLINEANNNIINNNTVNTSTTSTSTNYAGIVISGSLTSATSTGNNGNNNIISNNIVKGGYHSITAVGPSTTAYNSNNQIVNNKITDYYLYGSYGLYQDNHLVNGNEYTKPTRTSLSTNYSIYLSSSKNTLVEKNILHDLHAGAQNNTSTFYGIYITGDAPEGEEIYVINNLVYNIFYSGTAYIFYNTGADGVYYLHNTIVVNDPSASISNTTRGFFQTGSASNIKFLNNLIYIDRGGSGVKTGLYYGTSTSSIESDYNIIYVPNGNIGYYGANVSTLAAWQALGFDLHSTDVNPVFAAPNLLDYTPTAVTANNIGKPLGVQDDILGATRCGIPDAGAFENRLFIPTLDVGIASIDSPFVFCASPQNVFATVLNYGNSIVNNTTINWSVNGVVQTPLNYTTPLDTFCGSNLNKATINLGSYNFTVAQNYTIKVWTSNPNNGTDLNLSNDTSTVMVRPALNGSFTVGGTAPDYLTIKDALTAIRDFGMCGPVTLNLRPGTYNEQILFGAIEGSSITNTLTIKSENNDSTSVIVSFDATSTDNYVMSFFGASNIIIKNLTLKTLNNTYSRVFELGGSSSNITIANNIIEGNMINPSTSTFQALIYDNSGSNDDNLKIINNILSGGSYGVYAYGSSTTSKQVGLEILNNKVATYYRGLYLYSQEAPKVIGNEIVSNKFGSYNSYYGIYAYYIDSAALISRNIIDVESGIYGMYVGNWEGSSTTFGVISNNFIHIGGTSATTGIYSIGTHNHLKIAHNSINITSTSATSEALYYGSSGTEVDVVNNIFVNTGGGYAAYYGTTTSLDVVNRNDYYAPSSQYLAYWGGNRGFLVDLRLASGKDVNSVSVNPYFKSYIDLHAALTVNNLGMPLPYVNVDIDGQTRSTSTPDLGADEFTPAPIDLTTISLLSPGESCGLTSAETVSMKIMNFGVNTITAGQTIQVHYKINNNPTVTESLTFGGNLLSLANTSYTFNTKANLRDSNTYVIKTWTTITGDGNLENDTLTSVIDNPVVQNFTWVEDFESMIVGTSDRFTRGWRTPETANNSWTVGESQTPTADTGPFHDFNPKTLTGNYIFMETNNGSSGSTFIIESPCINISNLSTPGINFAYHMYGQTIGSLHLDVVTPDSTYLDVWTQTGDQGNQWFPVALDLGQFSSYDIIQLQFRGVRGSGVTGDIALDDIRIGNIPRLNFPSTINDCGFVRLDAGNPGSSYDWSTGESTQKIEVIAGPLPVTKNITLTVVSPNGMKNYAEMQIVLQPGPYVFLGNDTVLCDLPSYTLDAGNPFATAFEWDNGNTTQTRTISTSGSYTVDVTALNCTKSDTIEVIMDVTPVAAFTYIDNPNNGVTVFNSTGSVGNTYKWLFGDGNGSNVNNPTHQFTGTSDSIWVTLIVSNNCGSDTLRQIVTNINTGIKNTSNLRGLEIYPNPSNGLFTVDIVTAKITDVQLTLYNVQGKLINHEQFEQISELKTDIDLKDQAKGLYYLKIKAGDEVSVKKIVIQ